jgi:hypothetical protein
MGAVIYLLPPRVSQEPRGKGGVAPAEWDVRYQRTAHALTFFSDCARPLSSSKGISPHLEPIC